MKITAPPYHEYSRLHLFSRDIAAQHHGITKNATFDIEGAILLTDLARNIKKIKKYRAVKEDTYRRTDGWYYISLKELAKRHPYMTEQTVRRALLRLRKAKVLVATDKLHRRKSEHMLWYSFADKDTFKEALYTAS